VNVIKKYPNRRLYCCRESRYITQEEIIKRVQAGNSLQIVAAKTGEDITKAVLLAALVQLESTCPRLSVEQIEGMIRPFKEEDPG
jgi:polyhydroxyalkanoate synthesis repressor PhaR